MPCPVLFETSLSKNEFMYRVWRAKPLQISPQFKRCSFLTSGLGGEVISYNLLIPKADSNCVKIVEISSASGLTSTGDTCAASIAGLPGIANAHTT